VASKLQIANRKKQELNEKETALTPTVYKAS